MTETAPSDTLWRGSARSSRDETRRRRLREAALELYGTNGYPATTVQSICRQAKVSSRSFYELYPQQEELLADLYRELNQEVMEGISHARVADGETLEHFVREMVAKALTPMLSDDRKARVLEVESVGISDELEQHRREAYRALARAIDEAFMALAVAGMSREAPGGLTSLILVGGITEALVQRVQTPRAKRTPPEVFIDQVSEVALRLLV